MDNQTTSSHTWPGAFGIYKKSKEAVMVNLYPILGVIGLYIAISVLLTIFGVKRGNSLNLRDLLDLLLSSAVTVALTHLLLAGIRDKKMDLDSALKEIFSLMTLKVVALSLLLGVITLGSLLLLIVPFFFIVPRLLLAPYFLIDKNMNVFDSLSASWDATKGSLSKVWGLIGVTVLFGLMFIVLIGAYLSVMYAASFGLLYTYLAGKSQADQPNTNASPITSQTS